ncbi:MAG: dihydrodipicolinate synthase family protein [Gemmatimonadetes bacterium]|nr:dihydrodipicolinate synthase family protein [Gemmatimonadota bacterium]
MSAFEGILPAIITPMTSDGAFHEEAFRKVMEFNIAAGVHGFWVAGGTGESILLSDEENMRIASAAADQSRGRVNNIMHVGAATTERAARLAEHAAHAGVEAICCVPPFFYGRTHQAIAEHYRIVAAAADLPLFVYNLPQSTGVEITPELMRRIQDRVPQLRGLKHSSPVFPNVRTFAAMGLSCLVGNHQLMLPALTIGAVGCVDGPPVIAPEYWVEIWKAYRAGDLQRAETAQDRASRLWEALGACGGEFHSVAKAALGERLGIECGAARPPGTPMTEEQRQALRRIMGELSLV